MIHYGKTPQCELQLMLTGEDVAHLHTMILGFELNKEYFDIAQRRIALERQQLQLDFIE